MTEQEKQGLKEEIITEAVPQIVKNIMAELEKEKGQGQKENSTAINYEELVKNSMK